MDLRGRQLLLEIFHVILGRSYYDYFGLVYTTQVNGAFLRDLIGSSISPHQALFTSRRENPILGKVRFLLRGVGWGFLGVLSFLKS